MARLCELHPDLWRPETGANGELDPSVSLVGPPLGDVEQPITIEDLLNGPETMSDQIRKLGFAVIRMHPEWQEAVEDMDQLARRFFWLPGILKRQIKSKKNTRGYCPPGTIPSDATMPNLPDFNERLITGGTRPFPNTYIPFLRAFTGRLESRMLRCLKMSREVFNILMAQEAARDGADQFFKDVAEGKITFDDEPYQQFNNFGHKSRRVPRKDNEPLQTPHIDLTVATILFARGRGGQPAPGLTVQLPDGRWALLMASPGEAIVSFQMELPNGVKPMQHFVSNPGKRLRRRLRRISAAAFFNPDLGQTNLPPEIKRQAVDEAQKTFEQEFENQPA